MNRTQLTPSQYTSRANFVFYDFGKTGASGDSWDLLLFLENKRRADGTQLNSKDDFPELIEIAHQQSLIAFPSDPEKTPGQPESKPSSDSNNSKKALKRNAPCERPKVGNRMSDGGIVRRIDTYVDEDSSDQGSP